MAKKNARGKKKYQGRPVKNHIAGWGDRKHPAENFESPSSKPIKKKINASGGGGFRKGRGLLPSSFKKEAGGWREFNRPSESER